MEHLRYTYIFELMLLLFYNINIYTQFQIITLYTPIIIVNKIHYIIYMFQMILTKVHQKLKFHHDNSSPTNSTRPVSFGTSGRHHWHWNTFVCVFFHEMVLSCHAKWAQKLGFDK